MKHFSPTRMIFVLLALLAAAIVGPRWLNHGLNGRLAVRVIVAESADQSFWTMTGVGEVIRHRGAIKGFSVLKKDLELFYRQQPAGTRSKAQTAWLFSRLTNLTQGATHFENVKAFGAPPWEHEMRKTVHMGDLQFYRRKKLKRKKTASPPA